MEPQKQLSFDLNAVTALGPNDPDDGDAGRQQRGMAIAAIVRLEKHRLGYRVPSQSGNGSYIVDPNADNPCCSCPDFDLRQQPCKHIYAVQITGLRATGADGSMVETTSITTIHRREWSRFQRVCNIDLRPLVRQQVEARDRGGQVGQGTYHVWHHYPWRERAPLRLGEAFSWGIISQGNQT